MKKCMFMLLGLLLGLSHMYAGTSADVQGSWTLSQVEGDDTTVVSTPEEKPANGARYSIFTVGTTTLNIGAADYTFIHSDGASEWVGTADQVNENLTLSGFPPNCGDCGMKVHHFIVRSVTATELVLDLFDEDVGTSTFAHLTFTK